MKKGTVFSQKMQNRAPNSVPDFALFEKIGPSLKQKPLKDSPLHILKKNHLKLSLDCLVLDVVELGEVGYDGQVGVASDAPADHGLGGVDVHRDRVGEIVH